MRELVCHKLLDYLVKNQTSGIYCKDICIIIRSIPFFNYKSNNNRKNLFSVFAEKYFTVSNSTRIIILTTMKHLYKYGPNLLESNINNFFQKEFKILYIELQTRTYGYLKIIQISRGYGDMTLVNALFLPIPPFNIKTNPLLKRLNGIQQGDVSNYSNIEISKFTKTNNVS